MTTYKVEVITRGTTLGEGPHWVAETESLFFVDLLDPAIYRYVPSTGQVYKIVLGTTFRTQPSFIIPLEGQKNRFVVGYFAQIILLEWDGESTEFSIIKTIVDIQDKYPGTRFNDAKCDPQGRIWVGTFGQSEDEEVTLEMDKGVLFSLDLNGNFTEHVDKIGLANGMAWSKDGTKFYFTDSGANVIYLFDFDGVNGKLSNQRVFFDGKKNGIADFPDGMCIDAEDNLWVAVFHGAKVLHLDGRTGEILPSSIDFEGRTSKITSAAFGGRNLDTLYVTSTTFRMSPEQIAAGTEADAGAVFKVTGLAAKGPGPAGNYKGVLAL